MMAADDINSAGLTAKDRLARIEEMLDRMDRKMDAKFDVLAARITAIEVSGSRQAQEAEKDLVSVEVRLRALETNVAPLATTVVEKVHELSKEHEKLDEAVQALKIRVLVATGSMLAVIGAINAAQQLGWLKF